MKTETSLSPQAYCLMEEGLVDLLLRNGYSLCDPSGYFLYTYGIGTWYPCRRYIREAIRLMGSADYLELSEAEVDDLNLTLREELCKLQMPASSMGLYP